MVSWGCGDLGLVVSWGCPALSLMALSETAAGSPVGSTILVARLGSG